MRIAFTSSDGVTVDQHFGQTRDFRIWEVGADSAAEVDTITALPVSEAPQGAPSAERGGAAGTDLDEEDRIAARASAVAGCAIVYTVAIGGPPAAKLVARKIHPMKTGSEVPIASLIAKLQEVLRGTPPPWLRKAMNGGAPSPAPLRGAAEVRGQTAAEPAGE
jgi:nitrogen fixation protein NifX